MSKILILDRDGVINHDSEDYIKSPQEWRPIDGSLEAIARLHKAGFIIVVATNQSGVARNLYSIDTLNAIHKKMSKAVEANGGLISGIFYCPHHPADNCDCRKPGTGLLSQIAQFLNSDLQLAPFIGASLRDIQAATNFGCTPVLVKTGYGCDTYAKLQQPYPPVFADLYQAANWLLEKDL